MTQLLADLDQWLDAQWDPGLKAGEWWASMGAAGWVAPSLPRARYGRDASPDEATAIAARITERGALGAPAGPGISVVAPALAAHLADDDVDDVLLPTVTGELAWCLLFSEPGAGTDLANLTTTATRDGDGWRLDGRKTWATGAHVADRALVLARSDPDGARHRGLTCFVLDVRQPDAVEVRPMREMTGRALSNDVWLRGAWTTTVLGGVGDGWRVVNTALSAERSSIGSHRSSPGRAGSSGGDLDRPAGEVVTRAGRGRRALQRRRPRPWPELRRPAPVASCGTALPACTSAAEVARLTAVRTPAVPGAANIAKLWAGAIARRGAEVAAAATGANAMLHDYDDGGPVTSLVLSSPAVSLVGGVDLVQRDLLGERVLGLPKAPDRGDRAAP